MGRGRGGSRENPGAKPLLEPLKQRCRRSPRRPNAPTRSPGALALTNADGARAGGGPRRPGSVVELWPLFTTKHPPGSSFVPGVNRELWSPTTPTTRHIRPAIDKTTSSVRKSPGSMPTPAPARACSDRIPRPASRPLDTTQALLPDMERRSRPRHVVERLRVRYEPDWKGPRGATTQGTALAVGHGVLSTVRPNATAPPLPPRSCAQMGLHQPGWPPCPLTAPIRSVERARSPSDDGPGRATQAPARAGGAPSPALRSR